VEPGLGCLHNKHLLALVVDQSHWIAPSAAAAIDWMQLQQTPKSKMICVCDETEKTEYSYLE
jgi:hypothetical protein